jgi:hypothetical protein
VFGVKMIEYAALLTVLTVDFLGGTGEEEDPADPEGAPTGLGPPREGAAGEKAEAEEEEHF